MEVLREQLIDMSAPEPLATVNRNRMARDLNISVSSASRILSGKRIPQVVTMKRISDYLGMTLDKMYELLGLDK